MNVRFKIDNRENKLLEILDKSKFSIEPLDIGDFQIIIENEQGEQRCSVFERKTISDLESSIKDGRWQEQKLRCISSGWNIVYIIENWSKSTMKNKMVTSAVLNMFLKGNIKIFLSSGLTNTAEFINELIERVQKNPLKYFEHVASGHNYDQCLVNVKQKKKENVNKKQILTQQLCAIPGISWKKATSLIEELNIESIGELCEIVKLNANALNECKGIGKCLSTNIIDNII